MGDDGEGSAAVPQQPSQCTASSAPYSACTAPLPSIDSSTDSAPRTTTMNSTAGYSSSPRYSNVPDNIINTHFTTTAADSFRNDVNIKGNCKELLQLHHNSSQPHQNNFLPSEEHVKVNNVSDMMPSSEMCLSNSDASNYFSQQLKSVIGSYNNSVTNKLTDGTHSLNAHVSDLICLARDPPERNIHPIFDPSSVNGMSATNTSVNNSIESLHTSKYSKLIDANGLLLSSNCTDNVNTSLCDNLLNKTPLGNNCMREQFPDLHLTFNDSSLNGVSDNLNTNHEKDFESNIFCSNTVPLQCDLKNLPNNHHEDEGNYFQKSSSVTDVDKSTLNKSESPIFDGITESRTKQRRKSRKPLKSSVRYLHSSSPILNSELSPPPTLTSPPPPPLLCSTPPAHSHGPLSPPLSDLQSSVSSLSPCSSITSDETVKYATAAKAPLPRLLPISATAPPNSTNLTNMSSNSNNYEHDSHNAKSKSSKQDLIGSSSSSSVASFVASLNLPPPPPYSTCKKDNGYDFNKCLSIPSDVAKSSECPQTDPSCESDSPDDTETSPVQCNGDVSVDKRPPPPPYHSHFYNGSSNNDSTMPSCLNDNNKRSHLDEQASEDNIITTVGDVSSFWKSVHLPGSLSVSPVSDRKYPSDKDAGCVITNNESVMLSPSRCSQNITVESSIIGSTQQTLPMENDAHKNGIIASSAAGNGLSHATNYSTVKMLLQQLAAAQSSVATATLDSFPQHADAHRQFSPSIQESCTSISVLAGSPAAVSADTASNSKDTSSSAASDLGQESDHKLDSSNTINIDVNESNLSNLLNSLVTKSSSTSRDTGHSDTATSMHSKAMLEHDNGCNNSNSTSSMSTPIEKETSRAELQATCSPLVSSPSSISALLQTSQLLSQLSNQSMISSVQQPNFLPTSPSPRPSTADSGHLVSSPEDINASDPASRHSISTDGSEDHVNLLQKPNMNALLTAAALQNSYGLPPGVMDSPLSRLMMGNSSSSSSSSSAEFANYATLCGVDPSILANSYPGLSGAIQGVKTPNSDVAKGDNLDKSLSSFTDNSGGLNNLNSMATLSYLLHQQQQQQLQMESVGLAGGGGVPSGLNNLSAFTGLAANVSGLSGLADPDNPLHHVLKKLRYSDGVNPIKRKPRSSNHTKSFHCSLCSKRFSLKDELEEHMLTHTSDELGNESYMQKSFACNECSFRTKYKFCLQRHMHIHSGEKPLVCPYCRYRSISKVSYDNHIRTHTGEKPFACPYCSYKSSFKNNLTKHIKTHTGSNKPYTCNKCSSCFTSQMQLKAHMRLHMDPAGSHNCSQCLYTCMSRFELECHMRTHVPV